MGRTVNFLDYALEAEPFPVNTNGEEQIVINTINQYSYCVAQRDNAFKKALQSSTILLPDGMAVVKACTYLTGQPLEKIAGADMHEYLLQQINQKGGKCFYLGSTSATLTNIQNRLKQDYPAIQMEYYAPPFKNQFSKEDIESMVKIINSFEPIVLFIGLTAPKQEKLAFELKEKVNAPVICSIGAVFDFYAGSIERPGQFWINMNLEWFVRLVKEPKRMWKRYLLYGSIFIYDILSVKFKAQRSTHALH